MNKTVTQEQLNQVALDNMDLIEISVPECADGRKSVDGDDQLNVRNLPSKAKTVSTSSYNTSPIIEPLTVNSADLPVNRDSNDLNVGVNRVDADYLSMKDRKFVHQVQQYIKTHISDPELSVEQLARQHHLCVRQFRRRFEKFFNVAPGIYIRRKRLTYSTELLRKGMDIGSVVLAVGYSNHSHFSQIFKKHYNKMTPREYKRKYCHLSH